jgi:hypothetical protein
MFVGMFVLVSGAFMVVRFLTRFGTWIVFEGICRTQRFAFRARQAP